MNTNDKYELPPLPHGLTTYKFPDGAYSMDEMQAYATAAVEIALASPEVQALREAAQAALAYDSALQSCANNPDAMASFCTAEGDDLDSLYAEWISKARVALGGNGEVKMTQVKMPEPVAKIVSFGAGLKEVSWRKGCMSAEGASLITTEQAEAYARARVREALEKAVSICDATYEQGSAEYAVNCNPYFEGGCDAAESIEQKILALIPKEST